jgi:hypothetical protein
VVIQDIDEQASAEKVLEVIAMIMEGDAEEARVNFTMTVSRGQKWMVMLLPAAKTAHVQGIGKLRVGYVSCRIKY